MVTLEDGAVGVVAVYASGVVGVVVAVEVGLLGVKAVLGGLYASESRPRLSHLD